MNMTVQQAAFRRGRILRILAESNDQGASAQLIRNTVSVWGYKADTDTVVVDLAWLSRQGLVTVRDVAGIDMAKITQAGREVVSRDLDVPGVKLLDD